MAAFYLDDTNGKGHNVNWTKQMVEDMRRDFSMGKLQGNYGLEETKNVHRHLMEHMNISSFSHVLVIGSQVPKLTWTI